MFVHHLNPVLISIGPLSIRWYGLIYAAGFVLTYYALRRVARKKLLKNFDESKIDSLFVYLVLGTVLGARILQFVFFRPQTLLSDPLELVKIWHGGLSFHGGLIGVALAMLLFSHRYKIPFWSLADVLVVPAAFALALGRIANFINAELYGTITSVPWCVQFPAVEGCRHPTQVYESLKTFAIGFVLYGFSNRLKKPGQLFWLFITLYGFLRFLINFYRDETPILGVLSMGQLLSLGMGVVGAVFLAKSLYSSESSSP